MWIWQINGEQEDNQLKYTSTVQVVWSSYSAYICVTFEFVFRSEENGLTVKSYMSESSDVSHSMVVTSASNRESTGRSHHDTANVDTLAVKCP